MKIAIVEDQKAEQERLSSYIKTYCQQAGIAVEINCFNDGLHITSDYQKQFDLIYLDVEMEVMDGMTTAQKIRSLDKEVLLVFVTNHSHVAIQGYSVEAIDFLLKPLNSFVFEEHFKKILRKLLAAQEKQSLYIKSKQSTLKLCQEDIIYLESQGHQVHIHTIDGETTITHNTLKNLEALLDRKLFVRTHSAYIINLSQVQKVEGNLVYVKGIVLPISRPRKKEFMAALTHFIGDSLL
ncbi:LytR/AlgR family response regulator transcription factor [Streptococcus ruminantium]|uniref:LytTR family DNA-binding domain-containing protein n=1 Tax=Streptococcus ruminantium TaxID=1917441 RepID=A0ABU1B5I9_9STRE|nr:LytTR family DNA-binding domain-containing protein [Streptococcus ruminantium]MDQ8759025.1 LytTR family DNA-binding domain-containing protein [Streptococcus ruminantium]MDQ8768402.1 LytTR family DNA-binding domain-containing protein [Streptococcus ruminantium]MDQ8775166.1 LytTR family DNA-binding domain-containing protein [Streptococcus ruminantium]MDQ8793785.1 LytTR family DNA-binding domain-containing protein [Streptococcus ruminantium]MDQ8796333.1 LytTR family DNA-binding domain-containi